MEGKHISLASLSEKHESLVICVRGNAIHGETHHCDTDTCFAEQNFRNFSLNNYFSYSVYV